MNRRVIGHVLYVPIRCASSIGFTQSGDPSVPSNGSNTRNLFVSIVKIGPALQVVRTYNATGFNNSVLNWNLAARSGGYHVLATHLLGSYFPIGHNRSAIWSSGESCLAVVWCFGNSFHLVQRSRSGPVSVLKNKLPFLGFLFSLALTPLLSFLSPDLVLNGGLGLPEQLNDLVSNVGVRHPIWGVQLLNRSKTNSRC